jgi:hypothetical protein
MITQTFCFDELGDIRRRDFNEVELIGAQWSSMASNAHCRQG